MGKEGKNNTMMLAIVCSVIVGIILIAGTYWNGYHASRDTEKAVRNVSLMYLDELAARREQVLASTLSGYINDLDVALRLMEKDDLSSVDKLQAYQYRMKQLYALDKFAFVDETGLIYTSRGTRTDIDQYAFDPNSLSEPEIFMKNSEGSNKKVIIAVPTDNLPFEGHSLVVCFMEIDMDYMLENLSFQSGTNNTTFCNIYATDGKPLTNMTLGGLSSDANLLSALETATFEEGYDIEKTRSDFSEGRSGVISFTYNGIKETMHYVPVRRTDWMLTYLIRESVISEQIDSISEGIVTRSLILSALTALVLIGAFAMILIQSRKAAKLAVERETAEMMQQELEERIALQDELIEQEKLRAQQDNMITALSSDYRSVFYANLATGTAVCYRGDGEISGIKRDDTFEFSKVLTDYANAFITEEYRSTFIDFISPQTIQKNLSEEPVATYHYLTLKNGRETYEMIRMAGVGADEVGVGFADIDREMRETLANNQALSDALKTAEEASRAKTTFLSNMSHEIRTPMNAIIGIDALALNDDTISDSTRDYLEKIGTSARHLLSLINDILDMSRIESGRMVLKNEEFEISKLLEQINIIFSSQCQEKGLEYNCSVNGELSDYYIGDCMKLRQILINILGNAVKFTPEHGKVSLTVEKTGHFDNRSTIQFTISDTGIGMSEDYLPKIFDTFSQEETGDANRYGSTGLGMAITKNLVEMMNGQIRVSSKKGEGTTFFVTVTLTDSDKKRSTEGDIEINLAGQKVLVVDDDPLARDQAKLILSKIGVEADMADSGAGAVEAVKVCHARQEPYTLIIIDWKMPDMDGVETARQIRSIIGEDTAIIILTAYNWDEILDEALAAGVDSFIAKPLFSSNLIEELQEVMRKRRLSASPAKEKTDITGCHILLAEDMEINAEILIEILRTRSIETDHAEDGTDAVELFKSHPEGYYDAILMDMRMAEMDGLTATQKIRAMDRKDAASIPIIALTANAFDEDVQRSLQAGLNAHLSKPVEPDLLFETLERLIKRG